MPNQSMNLWNNPIYAWQQQLATGANLAKNLNPGALLGLVIGTGMGNWLGNKLWNWQELRKQQLKNPPDPVEVNPVAVNAAVQSTLGKQGDFDLGWKPQYQFPTANKLFNDRFTPNWNWQQNLRSQAPYFPMTPPVTQTPQNPLPSTTSNPWNNNPLNFGTLTQRY